VPIETIRGIYRFTLTKKISMARISPPLRPTTARIPPRGEERSLEPGFYGFIASFPPLCLFIPRRCHYPQSPPGETAIFNPSSLDRTGGSSLPPPNAAIARPPATAPHSSSARHPPNPGLCHPPRLTRLTYNGAMTTTRKTLPLFYCIFVSSRL